MIIQELSFHVSAKATGDVVFAGTTVFGFFPPDALARQVGISASPEERARIAERCAVVADLRARDARYCSGPLALPAPMLTMIDRVCAYTPRGAPSGLARVRTEKDIDAGEWFFKAHFYQDPVQPGSLGVEAMIQALMWTAIHERRHEGMVRPRFEALAVDAGEGERVVWKYRGQVVPKNRTVTCELDLVSVHDDRTTGSVTLRADATLWVDGTKIYATKGLALRIVDDG
jgi:3-hydroxymyristoyl/3-hydroxydecanoyl-(acyl carrier protein) dehydratase